MLKPAARATGRLLHGVLVFAFALAGVAVVAAAVLAWRLSQGPVDLAWVARRIEAAVNQDGGPTRLHIGGASLAWEGFSGGVDRPLELRLRDLRAVDAEGAAVAEVPAAEVSLSLRALLAGQVAPRGVRIEGARLRVLRAADGDIGIDLGSLAESLGEGEGAGPKPPAVRLPQLLADLARPLGHGGPRIGGVRLGQLRRVVVQGARIEVVDRQFGLVWRAPRGDIDLRRPPGGGLSGTADVALEAGRARTRLLARAEVAGDGAIGVQASLGPVDPALLAGALPVLAPLAAFDAALELSATGELSPDLLPRRAELRATSGAGRVRVAGGDIALTSAVLEAQAEWDGPAPRTLRVGRVEAVVPSAAGGRPTTLTAAGTATLGADGARAEASVGFDRVAVSDLPRLWPPGVAKNAREWLAQNVTAGTLHTGRFVFGFAADPALTKVALTATSGTMKGEDVTVSWLRPVPPIERIQATMALRGPDAIDIAVESGRTGNLRVSDGSVKITGLSRDAEALAVDADVSGPVAELVALLRHPRLKLLDRGGVRIANPGGALAGKLSVRLPLILHLGIEDVAIRATGRLTDLHLGGIAAGRDLDRGDVQAEVTTEGLKASGQAAVGGIPAQLSVELDFRPGPPGQVVTKVAATGRATAPQLLAAGVDTLGVMTGPALLDTAFTQRRDGRGEFRVRADLRETALEFLGWSKPPGAPATAAARLVVLKDDLASIEDIEADGPGLHLRGRSEVVAGKPSLLRLDRAVLGRSQGAGEVRLPLRPGEPVRAKLSGPSLDLAPQFARDAGPPRAARPGADTPWTAEGRFERVHLSEAGSLGPAWGSAEHDGRRLRRVMAETGGPERVRVAIVPVPGGRDMALRAADAGALLRALDISETLEGGQLSVGARYDDTRADSPLHGTADLSDFAVRDAAGVGKVLQALTVYGLLDVLRGPGLQFGRATIPFRYDGDTLEIGEARAFSASLGVTAQGRFDLARRLVDVRGTIVPAYVFNSLLGRIPLLGRLFSAERGGGLISVNYAVRGRTDDPAITVNPLSALTPGFLRGLFKIFD